LGLIFLCEDLHKSNTQPFGLVPSKRMEKAQIDPLCHPKSLINLFHNWNSSCNATWPTWFMMSWGSIIPCTFWSFLNMCNHTNYRFVKTSLISLAIHPNLCVDGACSIIISPLEILELMHIIFMNAPILWFQKL
jgi:hypothetical protein